MGLKMSSLPPAPARYQMRISFGVPTALNTDTVFSDDATGATFYQPLADNLIRDMKHRQGDPGAGIFYTVSVKRQDDSRKLIGDTGDFLTTFTGAQRPNMPLGLKAGWFQFVEQQTLGALTAQKYSVLFQNPMVV